MFDTKARVLIVDDMGTMRKIVAKICREMGFADIVEAADGALGWEAINSADPVFGLVISDWNMPNLTGLDLLRRVRADARFANLPFIMVTAEAEQHQIMDAVKARVSSYIVKPFTSAALREKIEALQKKAAA